MTLVLFILMAFAFNLKNKSLCRLITVLPCAPLHMSSIIFTPVFRRVTAGVARARLVTLAFCAKHLHESSVDFQGSIKVIRLTLDLLTRGGGTCSKLGAQSLNRGQNLGAQNQPFPSLRLKYWVRKCAPLRIRLHRPCNT